MTGAWRSIFIVLGIAWGISRERFGRNTIAQHVGRLNVAYEMLRPALREGIFVEPQVPLSVQLGPKLGAGDRACSTSEGMSNLRASDDAIEAPGQFGHVLRFAEIPGRAVSDNVGDTA